jgi:hypothetical protein
VPQQAAFSAGSQQASRTSAAQQPDAPRVNRVVSARSVSFIFAIVHLLDATHQASLSLKTLDFRQGCSVIRNNSFQ